MRLYSDLALWNGLTIRRGLAGAIPKSTCDPSIWLIRGANKLRRNWINEWPNMGSRQRARNGGLWVLVAEARDRRGRAELLSSSISRVSAFPILRRLSLLLANRVRILRLLVDLNIGTMRDDKFTGLWDQNE